jgi:hypothetical protein
VSTGGGQEGVAEQIDYVTELAVSGVLAVVNLNLDRIQNCLIGILREENLEELFKLAVAVDYVLAVIREALGELGVFVAENEHIYLHMNVILGVNIRCTADILIICSL